MAAAPFDTLKLTKALREKAHFTQDQAEGLTEALSDSFEEHRATKGDISDLKREIADVRKYLALLEQRLTNKIDRMTIALGAIVIAAMSAATVVIKFVHT